MGKDPDRRPAAGRCLDGCFAWPESKEMGTPMSEAERIKASIGIGLGVTFILGIWVVGAIITGLLALLTRPKA